MTYREIYKAALRLLCENDSGNSDYEERAEYLLATLCTELSSADNRYRALCGEGPQPPFAKVCVDADDTFPLSDVFLPIAEYYLAAMLVIDENEELSERYFALYTDRLGELFATPRAQAKPIRDRYRLL